METGWKIVISVFALLALGTFMFNYFTFGKLLLSPADIALAQNTDGMGILDQLKLLLTWPILLSTFILIFVILFVNYKLKKIKYEY